MKAKKYGLLALLVAFCSALLSVTVSGFSFEEKLQLKRYGVSTLKGLKGVCPKVNLFPREGVNLPLVTENTLQTAVELELRKAGIKVLTDTNDFDVGLFAMTITIDKVKGLPLYNVGATVSLSQYAGLLRNSEILTYSSVWPLFPTPISYCAGEAVLEQLLNDIVTNQSKKFCNDYLAANLKETKNRLEDLIKPENQATEEIVFTGIPRIKILIENGSQGTPEKLSQAKSIEYKCTITKVDNKYYWTTRENVELISVQSGIYTTFIAVNGAGYVRIIDPEMKKIAFKEGDQPYDYMEHLLLGLSTISYYGTSK